MKQLSLAYHVAMGGSVNLADLDVKVFGHFQAASGCAAHREILRRTNGALLRAEYEERGAARVRRLHGHAVAIVPIEAVAVGAFAPR